MIQRPPLADVDAERPSGGALRLALASFAVRPFRWVWAAALCGNSGRFGVIVVAGWEAYRLGNHSAVWPSLVSFFLLVPTMMFGLVAGSFADRLNRAKLAGLGQAVNATACATAGACIFAHVMNLDGVLAAAAVVGVGNSIQGPAWQALVPTLVGPERMVNAALALRIAQQGSELVGPAITTAILTTVGPGWAFLVCSAFYVAGSTMMVHLREHARAAMAPAGALRTTVRRQVVEGVSYIRRSSPIGLLFVWVTCHCSLTMATFGILPTIASVNFHGSASVYGLLLTTFGLGSIIGPLALMSLRQQREPGWVLWVSGLLSGGPLIGIGLIHIEVLAMVMSMLAGVGQAVFMSMIYSSIMTCSPNSMRGRVSSIQLSATTGAMGLASIGWGALVSLVSAGLVLAAPGAVFVLICTGLSGKMSSLNSSLRTQGRLVKSQAESVHSQRESVETQGTTAE